VIYGEFSVCPLRPPDSLGHRSPRFISTTPRPTIKNRTPPPNDLSSLSRHDQCSQSRKIPPPVETLVSGDLINSGVSVVPAFAQLPPCPFPGSVFGISRHCSALDPWSCKQLGKYDVQSRNRTSVDAEIVGMVRNHLFVTKNAPDSNFAQANPNLSLCSVKQNEPPRAQLKGQVPEHVIESRFSLFFQKREVTSSFSPFSPTLCSAPLFLFPVIQTPPF